MRLAKLDIVNVFNEVIDYLLDQKAVGRELPRNLEVMDMKFEMIHIHLRAIGQRALEIGDQEIQARLIALGILIATPEDTKKVEEALAEIDGETPRPITEEDRQNIIKHLEETSKEEKHE